MDKIKEKVSKLKIKFGNSEDLDLNVFTELKKSLQRKLLQGEMVYIRYLLDQDESLRYSIIHDDEYSDDFKE